MNLATLYRNARMRLTEAGIGGPALEARMIIEGITDTSPEDVVCRPMLEVDPDKAEAVDKAIARRIAGEPVHRILGQREFYGLKLKLSPNTLEPRPDTETLVDAVLPFVRQCVAVQDNCHILDLGTGTGAIALALLSQVSEATAIGTDVEHGALEAARNNAIQLGLADRFEPIMANWFDPVVGRFDLIVSNPPYIRTDVISTLDREVREHDPILALDGGMDGLDAYRTIAAGAAEHLAEGGLVAVEIGFDQAESVASLFQDCGFEIGALQSDLGGNDRVLLMKMRQ